MKVSFITTVFNESATIREFLDSLVSQTTLPDEIIIVDGNSTDDTVDIIKKQELRIKSTKLKFKVLIKKGNRSVGRNEAIRNATGEIIVCSDSGNILDKNWIKKITEPFENKKIDVVAGYYKGIGKTVFQKCVIPYALVMPDKADPDTFLPATRSVAFRKSVWQKVGKFDERFSHNEDYAFAKALQKAHAKIVFKKDAVVYWKPRNTFKDAFIMMYRFAYGDAQARIIRPKVILIFIRYLIAIFLIVLFFITKSFLLLTILILLLLLYLIWAAVKNYKYVKEWQAIFILPLLQLVADWAVVKGTVLGLLGRKIRYN
jgi:glycosyltransferase involved in cell wall biosynthesis